MIFRALGTRFYRRCIRIGAFEYFSACGIAMLWHRYWGSVDYFGYGSPQTIALTLLAALLIGGNIGLGLALLIRFGLKALVWPFTVVVFCFSPTAKLLTNLGAGQGPASFKAHVGTVLIHLFCAALCASGVYRGRALINSPTSSEDP